MSTPTPDPASATPTTPTAPTPLSRTELLRWQFELTWSLFEYHLERLEPDDFL